MDKIFFIYQKGFRQISLPNGEIINIESCDDGCYITTEIDLKEAEQLLQKYIGMPIYEILCDDNKITSGEVLARAQIVKHAPYEVGYDHIWIYGRSANEDGKRIIVVE